MSVTKNVAESRKCTKKHNKKNFWKKYRVKQKRKLYLYKEWLNKQFHIIGNDSRTDKLGSISNESEKLYTSVFRIWKKLVLCIWCDYKVDTKLKPQRKLQQKLPTIKKPICQRNFGYDNFKNKPDWHLTMGRCSINISVP